MRPTDRPIVCLAPFFIHSTSCVCVCVCDLLDTFSCFSDSSLDAREAIKRAVDVFVVVNGDMQEPPIGSPGVATTTTDTTTPTATTKETAVTSKEPEKEDKVDPKPATKKAASKKASSTSSKFEDEEEENWPAVDVGNLIEGLDADIDTDAKKSDKESSEQEEKMSGGASPNSDSNHSSNGQEPKAKMAPKANNNGGGGGSNSDGEIASNNNSPASPSSSSSSTSSSAAEKSLKMKIKRTKAGTTRNPEGKLEIVQGASPGTSLNGGQAAEGTTATATTVVTTTEKPLNAADVVNAVTAAVGAKQANKVKLTSGSKSSWTKNGNAINSNGQEVEAEATEATEAGKEAVVGSPGSSNNGDDSSSGPPAKKMKVRRRRSNLFFFLSFTSHLRGSSTKKSKPSERAR